MCRIKNGNRVPAGRGFTSRDGIRSTAEELSTRESQIAQLTDELDSFQASLSEVERERDALVERLAAQDKHTTELSKNWNRALQRFSLEEYHEEYTQCIATQVDQIEQLTSQLEAVQPGSLSLSKSVIVLPGVLRARRRKRATCGGSEGVARVVG